MAKTLGVNYRNIEADLDPPHRWRPMEANGGRWRASDAVAAAEAISAAVRKEQHEMMGFATSEANSHFLRSGKKSMRREA